mmetsp:Transcript_117454/g.339580  ORF Transcript_117454/g.339580 Transcript_117454/m.339580 type:complete len:211 (+) Transcript_117454:98-730(+)
MGDNDCCCLACVRTQEVGVVEDLGEFKRLLGPGLHFVLWPLESVVGRMSLRIQQLDVMCETKTKDNVFVKVGVAVQYRVIVDSAYDAFYRLTDPRNQVQSYVFDVVRSTVPKMELDEAFQAKEDVAEAVLTQLRDVMADYGYEIKQTLVTDLSPDARVKAGMPHCIQKRSWSIEMRDHHFWRLWILQQVVHIIFLVVHPIIRHRNNVGAT